MTAPRIVSSEEVARLIDPLVLAERMRTQLLEPMSVPPRAVAEFSGTDERLLLAMPAAAEDLSITKVVSVRRSDGKDQLASKLLATDADGRLLALIDGEELTARRTAAASLLAARLLAVAAPRTLAVLGALADRQKRSHALTAVRFPSTRFAFGRGAGRQPRNLAVTWTSPRSSSATILTRRWKEPISLLRRHHRPPHWSATRASLPTCMWTWSAVFA